MSLPYVAHLYLYSTLPRSISFIAQTIPNEAEMSG